MKIEEFTICLHCGCTRDVTDKQIEALRPLESKYKVHWNNRIDRYPGMYSSYSQLINHSIATSHTEWLILINDRTFPTVDEVEKMIKLLQQGTSCVFLYNVGFMGFAKELIRKIGWWDERFIHGGWEDRDWVFRLAEANLSLYESQESTYDYTWKSPLNVPGGNSSTPHWLSKWNLNNYNHVLRVMPEQTYQHWDMFLGEPRENISSSWTSWGDSKLNIDFGGPGSGPSGSSILANRKIIDT